MPRTTRASLQLIIAVAALVAGIVASAAFASAATLQRGAHPHKNHQASDRRRRAKKRATHRPKKSVIHKSRTPTRKPAPSASGKPAGTPVSTKPSGPSPTPTKPTTAPTGTAGPASSTNPAASSTDAKMPCLYSSHHISLLDAFGDAVGRAFNCAAVYNDVAPDWSGWERPWFINNTYADESWKNWATAPGSHRTLVITQNLFPASENSANWLQLGASGAFKQYAVTLATNLVNAGLGSSIIRLAHEANGNWYPDSIPDTPTGDQQWIQFWRNTVIAMRSVPGANFQFDWTVNAGYRRIPLTEWYPGDDVVNIVGIDSYDAGVPANVSAANRWSYLYNQQDGLGAVASFAAAHGKPMSIGEWGVEPAQNPSTLAGGDDPAYVNGIASVVANNNVAYQTYFDSGLSGMQFFNSPQSIQAYRQAFGSSGTAVGSGYLGTPSLIPSPAPSLSITGGPADASTVSTSPVTFRFAVQSGYGAVCSLDGQAWRPCTSASSDVLPGLAAGFHRWNVQVSDSDQHVTLLGRAFVVSASASTALMHRSAATRRATAKRKTIGKRKTTAKPRARKHRKFAKPRRTAKR